MKCIHNNYKGGCDNGKEEMLSNVSSCVISIFLTNINCDIKNNGPINRIIPFNYVLSTKTRQK